jgi:hypothetical protein
MFEEDNKKELVKKDKKDNNKNIIKRTISLFIGSIEYHLKEGETLPSKIDKSFFKSLKNEKII